MNKKIITIFFTLFIFVSFLIMFTFSYINNKKSLKSETKYEDKILSIYVDNELVNSFPTDSTYMGIVKCNKTATASVYYENSKWKFSITNAKDGNIKCNAYFAKNAYDFIDESGANTPNLATNMIPVVYDNTNDVWKKAPTTQTGWYNYDLQTWANAVTVTSSTRSTYTSAAVGTQIPMSDIMGMWVWIPRYEYMTTNLGTLYAGGTQALPGGISIKFISGTSTTNDTNYLIHPTFRNGSTSYTLPNGSTASNYSQGGWDKELTGFWMGKFETGYVNYNTTNAAISSNILVKPDVYSIANQTASIQFSTVTNIQSDHGIGSTIETHMSKNDEWGAVAYLSQSAYGKYGNSLYSGANKEIYVNNAYDSTGAIITTGRSSGIYAGGNGSDSTQYGTYEYNNCPALAYNHTLCTESVRNANSTKGTGASTTGNIYGVYDMSGGLSEYVMGILNKTIPDSSGFSVLPSQKYWNNWTTIILNTACNNSICYGQGMSETGTGSSGSNYEWYNDYIKGAFSDNGYDMGHRGGRSSGSSSVSQGIFFYDAGDGHNSASLGFRASIS